MATTNNMAPKDRTALAVETGRAKEGQASLTRLQRAIGLKQRVQDLSAKKFGDPVPKIDVVKRVPFECEQDAIIVCLELEVDATDKGEPTFIRYGTAMFDTRAMSRTGAIAMGVLHHTLYAISQSLGAGFYHGFSRSQKGPLESAEVSAARLAITSCFEPPYTVAVQPGKDLTDVLDKHKIQGEPRNIVLVLPNMTKLAQLKLLGFAPTEHPHIIDIVDLSKMYQAYELRNAYSAYQQPQPTLQKFRPQLEHDWKDKMPIADVLNAVGGELLSSSKFAGEQAKSCLAACLKIAILDAQHTQWLRTAEQIDGGSFREPWRTQDTKDKIVDFLFKYDLLVTGPVKAGCVLATIKAKKDDLLRGDPDPAKLSASVLEQARVYARKYGYDQYLPMLVQNQATSRHLPGSSSSAIAATIAPDAAATTTTTGRDPTSAFVARATKTPYYGVPLPTGSLQSLPEKLFKAFTEAKKKGNILAAKFALAAEKTNCPRKCFEKYFTEKRNIMYDGVVHTVYKIPCMYYPLVASKVKVVASPQWLANFVVMLRAIIRDRQDVRCWYDALPSSDFRKEKNQNHHRFGAKMEEVLAILEGK